MHDLKIIMNESKSGMESAGVRAPVTNKTSNRENCSHFCRAGVKTAFNSIRVQSPASGEKSATEWRRNDKSSARVRHIPFGSSPSPSSQSSAFSSPLRRRRWPRKRERSTTERRERMKKRNKIINKNSIDTQKFVQNIK